MLRLDLNENLYLFFNPNSGALALANKKWIHSLAIFELASFLETNKLMLLDNEIFEYNKKIQESYNYYKNERGLNAYISPSYQCPMNCIYCFQKDQKSNYESLDIENIPDIINSIKQHAEERNIDKIIIVLFGGEPILDSNYNFINELLRICVLENILVKIVSSGTTLNKKFIALFKFYQDIILNLDITIDGIPEIHNYLRPFGHNKSFHIIKDNIDTLLHLGFKVIAKTNLGKSNVERIMDLIALYCVLNWLHHPNFYILFNQIRDYVKTDTRKESISENIALIKIVNIIENYPKKIKIEGIKNLNYLAHCFLSHNVFNGRAKNGFCNPDDGTTISITPSGEIYPCNWMTGNTKFKIGDIRDNTSTQIQLYNHCSECSIRTICGGGCLIERLNEDYYKNCFNKNIEEVKSFVNHFLYKYEVNDFTIIKKEFDF